MHKSVMVRQTRLAKFMTSLKIMLAMLIILIESICLTKSTNILINKRVNNTNYRRFFNVFKQEMQSPLCKARSCIIALSQKLAYCVTIA